MFYELSAQSPILKAGTYVSHRTSCQNRGSGRKALLFLRDGFFKNFFFWQASPRGSQKSPSRASYLGQLAGQRRHCVFCTHTGAFRGSKPSPPKNLRGKSYHSWSPPHPTQPLFGRKDVRSIKLLGAQSDGIEYRESFCDRVTRAVHMPTTGCLSLNQSPSPIRWASL